MGRSLGAVESADIDYRPISTWAVLASVLGLASPLAWLHPLLWTVPALTLVVGIAALAQINRQTAGLIGRKAAWFGLLAGVVCGVAAPTAYAVHYTIAAREGRQIGLLWFEYLQQNEPQKAFQLMEHPRKRLPPDDRIWDHLKEDELLRDRFDKFVRRPLIRTLLALDGRAKVRYYDSAGSKSGKRLEVFHDRFAVTWEDEQRQRRTLLVRLDLHRVTDRLTGEIAWFVDPQNDISPGPEFDGASPANATPPLNTSDETPPTEDDAASNEAISGPAGAAFPGPSHSSPGDVDREETGKPVARTFSTNYNALAAFD
ncbi:MAG: hypothetical protein AB7U73_10840 [Pirellulales bacterium]